MNNEKRYLLAVALSFLVLIVFYGPMMQKGANKPPQVTTPTTSQDTNLEVSKVSVPLSVSTETVIEPTEKTYELQNEMYTAEFTTRGAGIVNLKLKEWGKRKMGDVNLIEKSQELRAAFATAFEGESTLNSDAHYELGRIDIAQGEISFAREIPGEYRVTKSYRFLDQKSALQLFIQYENLNTSAKNIGFSITNQLHIGKVHDQYEKDQLESFVALENGKVLVRKEGKIKKVPFIVSDPLKWQALTRKYLAVILKPDAPAKSSETKLTPQMDAFESTIQFEKFPVQPNSIVEREFLIYAGPEYYDFLKEFGLEETLIQGTWGAFRHWLFLALRFCRNVTGGYGWAILLMTFLLKVVFSPFTHMSFDSMRKMQTVQPKLKAIQTQFKNDPTRMNRETMELYRRYKINPMGGCFPMLIQIPIFIGFYQVLAQFVELKGEAFFWIKDLTHADRLAQIPGTNFDLNILPILMILTMLWQQKVTPQPATSSPEQAKVMQWMPIIFGFLFYGLPSGLVLYWTLNNLLTVLHQMVFHRKPALAIEN